MGPMLLAVLNLLIMAVICLIVLLLIEWVARKFGVPENILDALRVLFALIFISYVVLLLLGQTHPYPLIPLRQ